MSNNAKLFVQDEDGNIIGTFMVDVESMLKLYHRRTSTNLNLTPEPKSDQGSPKVGLIRRATKTLGWYRDENGREELRVIPLDDQ